MSKIKVKLADGSEVEVEKPEGVFTQEEVDRDYRPKAEIEGMVNRMLTKRTEDAVSRAKKEWLEDPETRLQFLQAESIPLDAEGKVSLPEGGITQKDLEKRMQENSAFLRQQWEKDHLKQIEEKEGSIEALTNSLRATREQMLLNEIAEGARVAGVDPRKFDPVPGMGPYSAAVYGVRQLFQWDDASNMFALQGEGGPKFNPNGTKERPNIGALEFWKEVAAKDKAYKDGGWFPDNRPDAGPDLGRTNASSGNNDLMTASDAELAAHVGV